MNEFEERVLADLAELKTHVRWLVGDGNQGKIQELEQRLRQQGAQLQRLAGIGSALATAITVANVVISFLRMGR